VFSPQAFRLLFFLDDLFSGLAAFDPSGKRVENARLYARYPTYVRLTECLAVTQKWPLVRLHMKKKAPGGTTVSRGLVD
jgi:hypothetical protein